MNKTAIVTDTNSGFDMESGKKHGIFVLPMPVIINQKTYMELENISHQELYLALRQNQAVTSSQPSPGDILNLWDSIFLQGYDDLVYIPMSSGLSGSCETALGLARSYKGRVQVADNHRISLTQYQSVLDAARLANTGIGAVKIKEILEQHAMDASIYIMVDTLEYLKKSGRVTAAAAAFASVLNLKPVLTIQGSKLDAFSKARGAKQGERSMINALKKDRETRFKDFPDSKLLVATAGTFDDEGHALLWRDTVQAEFPSFKVPYIPLSCSIACHTGINAAGCAICEIL